MPALETVLLCVCLDEYLQFIIHYFILIDFLAREDDNLFLSLLAWGPAIDLIGIQFIEITK